MNFEEWIRWIMYRLGIGKIKIEENGREYRGIGYRVVYCHENFDFPLMRGQFFSNVLHPTTNKFHLVPIIIGVNSHKDNEISIKDNERSSEMIKDLKGGEDTFFPFPILTGHHHFYKLKYRFQHIASIKWIGIEFINHEYENKMNQYFQENVYIPLERYPFFGKRSGILLLNQTLKIENQKNMMKKWIRWDHDLNYIYLVGKYHKENIKNELCDKKT